MAKSEGKKLPDLSLIASDESAIAEKRLEIVRRLIEAERPTRTMVEREGVLAGVSVDRVYVWLRRYREVPSIESLLPQRPGVERGTIRIASEIDGIIRKTIQDFYLTEQKPKLKKLVAEVNRRCKRAGYAKEVSARTIKARVSKVPKDQLVRAREGNKAADDQFRPVTTQYRADYALHVVQVDHTRADIFVVDEVYRQVIGRPWLTLAVDVASRMVAGCYLSLEAPSALSVSLALTQGILPKERWLADRGIAAPWASHGIMDHLHFDNAKEFRCAALLRGCREYKIDPLYRPVATPHWGGHIERLIGTFMGEMHLLPGTSFSNVAEKGAYDAEAKAVMTLSEFEIWLAMQIIAYHGTIHRSLGLPPNAAFEDEMAKRKSPPTMPADPEQVYLAFLPFERRFVRRDGIQISNITYWDPVLSAWAGQFCEKMVVKYDPRDLSRVFLFGPDHRYWPIPYRDLSRPRITLWEHKRARAALRARGIAAVNETLLFDCVLAQRALVAESAAKTKAARRQSQRTAYALESSAPQLPVPLMESPEPEPASLARTGPRLPFKIEDWS